MIKLAVKCLGQTSVPHQKLQCRLCIVLAMIKLRQYEGAESDFRDIGDFDNARYLCSTYPDIYGDKKGMRCFFEYS